MSARIRQSSPALRIAVTLLMILLTGTPAMSQESASPVPGSAVPVPSESLQPSDVTQIFVPAHQPEVWPKGEWEVVETQEYRRLLDGLKRKQPEPAAAQISSANYQAIFTGKKLQAGQLTATIQQTTDSQSLSLDPINLAISSLWWEERGQSRKAVWGNAASGETRLIFPEAISSAAESPSIPERTLRGEWSVAGRKFSNRLEFDLKLLPAAVNELELYLPRTWSLTSSVGLVEGPFDLSEDSAGNPVPQELQDRFRQWNVQLGSEREGQLTMHQSSPGKPADGLLLAESDTTYLVHERELQIEARYELEAAFAPVSQVVFEVPASIRVFAVTYGAETNLEWQLRSRQGRQQVLIQLPDPLVGKSRPLRIQGLGQVQSGKPWRLPAITCSQAALLRGELHLTVDAPLELRSYQANGFRQTAISVQRDQQETLTFSQIASDPRASFTAFIGTPEFSVASQIVSRLTTGTEEWQIRSELTWIVQSGTRFVTTCEVRPGWEILDVRRASETALPVIADWRVLKGQNNEPAKLRIEFLDALTPMQSKRVLVLARRLPLTAGQSMSLACIEPLSCRSVEEFLWVESHSSPGSFLVADASSNVEQRKFETLPAYVRQSPLLMAPDSSATPRDALFFFSTKTYSEEQLVLNTTEPPYKAEVKVSLECTESAIQETLTFAIEPLDSPIDRLTISASGLGEGWNWDLESQQRMPVAMPLQVEAQEQFPGEDREQTRWELRLPTPQTKPFQVVAKRKRPRAGQHPVVLPFLPKAQAFHGLVECHTESDLNWDFQTMALEEEPLVKSGPEAAPVEIRRWRYESPLAQLLMEGVNSETVSQPLLARLQLTSLLNGNSHSAIHRARYDFEYHSDEALFSFHLPDRVKLIGVLVNGKPLRTKTHESGLIRLALPKHQNNAVEIRYETEWQTEGLVSSPNVPLLQTEVQILEFGWRLGLSPDLQLVRSPSRLSMITGPPATHWTRRFFGPLGRGSTSELFQPWHWAAWEGLFKPEITQQQVQEAKSPPSDFLPADWAMYEAQAPHIGETIELTVWRPSLGLRWAWVALLTTTILGFGLRMKAWAFRRQLGLFWFLATFAGAGLLPMPWAMIAGGSLTGTLLALLFPRRLLLWKQKATATRVHPGSTASFEHQLVITLTLLVAMGLGIVAVSDLGFLPRAHGQDASPAEFPRANAADSTMLPFNVLVPVEDPRSPKFDSSIVYVERTFLKKLQAAQPKPRPKVSYLISSAKYQAQVVEQNSVEMTATFDVAVLAPQQRVTVRLPIDGVFLGGPGHCLVDGQPHAVLLDPEGQGYMIDLAPRPTSGPAIAEKPRPTATTARNVETRQITLRLYGKITALPNGGRFSIAVPAVSSSVFHIRFPENYASIGVRGLPGQFQLATESRTLTARIGATKKLEVFWSQQKNLDPPTNQQPPKVFALATIHPLRIDWQIRVSSVPKLILASRTWTLPTNTIVQDVKSTHPVSYEVSIDRTSTALLIEFQDPVSGELTVDITCMTPRDPSSSALPNEIRIPALNLFRDFPQTDAAPPAEYQIGVVATPELALSPPSPDFLLKNAIHSISPEKFLTDFRQAATETRTLRNPQYAWRLTTPSPLELTQEPRLPKRRASVNQEGRIRKGEIRWTFTAEIDTTTATAFRHVLQVPRDLIIDSVSVQEDETERLVRWSQLGNRLELVLSDGTTGSQSVELTGHLPFEIEHDTRVPLPLIQVENATISDSRLRIYQDFHTEYKLELVGLGNLPTLDANGVKTERGIPRLLAGVHLANTEVSPELVVGDPLEHIHLHQAMIVTAPSADRYQMTTWLHLTELENSPQQFSVHLPVELTRDFRVELLQKPGEIVPYETISQPDQSLELIFDSVTLQEQNTLRIESSVATTEAVPWTVPEVDVSQAHVDDFVLGIPSSLAMQSTENAPIPMPILPTEFPEWMPQLDGDDDASKELRLYRGPAAGWQLISNPSPQGGETDPPQVRTKIWLTDPQAIAGETHAKLPESLHETMSWNWPPNTTLRAAMLDGELLSPTIDQDTKTLHLAIPTLPHPNQVTPRRTLQLYWIQEFDRPMSRFGQIDLDIPKPQSEEFESATLTVLATDQIQLITNEGLEALTPSQHETTKSRSGDFLHGSLPLHGDHWPVVFWTMDSRAESVLLVCLLTLLFGGLMYWGLRWNTGEWLHHHPAIAWTSLGLIWWGCLTASFFGFALVLMSPLFAFAAKFQSAKVPEAEQNAFSE